MTIRTVAEAHDLLIIRGIAVERRGRFCYVDGQQLTNAELVELARQLDGGDAPSKYGNRKTTVDGIAFDSAAEAAEYQRLRELEQTGAISKLALQPRFELLPGFRDADGNRHQPMYYVADFQFERDGRIVVIDVKGMRTDVYALKIKLFRYHYPHIVFQEVKA